MSAGTQLGITVLRNKEVLDVIRHKRVKDQQVWQHLHLSAAMIGMLALEF